MHRRLGRLALNLLTGPSLPLCAATIALLLAATFLPPRPVPTSVRLPVPLPGDAAVWLALDWGHAELWEYTSWDRQWFLSKSFPLWPIPAALLAMLWTFDGLQAWVFRSGRCQPRDRCFRCGYDLTGNVSGVCPECGTPASPAAGAGERTGTPASEGGVATGP